MVNPKLDWYDILDALFFECNGKIIKFDEYKFHNFIYEHQLMLQQRNEPNILFLEFEDRGYYHFSSELSIYLDIHLASGRLWFGTDTTFQLPSGVDVMVGDRSYILTHIKARYKHFPLLVSTFVERFLKKDNLDEKKS